MTSSDILTDDMENELTDYRAFLPSECIAVFVPFICNSSSSSSIDCKIAEFPGS